MSSPESETGGRPCLGTSEWAQLRRTGRTGPSTSPSQSPTQSQCSGSQHMSPWRCLAAPPQTLSDSQTHLEQKKRATLVPSPRTVAVSSTAKAKAEHGRRPTVLSSTVTQAQSSMQSQGCQTQQHSTLASVHLIHQLSYMSFTEPWRKLALLTYQACPGARSGLDKEWPAQTHLSAWAPTLGSPQGTSQVPL